MSLFRRVARSVAFLAAAAGLLATRPVPAKTACEWEDVDRIVAVGDVHGAYDRFVAILKAAGVIDSETRWSGGATHLVQLGDVLDRGADSRKVLDLLRKLEREAEAAGGMVHQLLGNHETMRMLGDLRYVSAGEYDGFASPNAEKLRSDYIKSMRFSDAPERGRDAREIALGFVEMRLAFGRDGEYGRWLRQLPTTIKINGIQFLHGGISPSVASMGCDRINDQIRRELTADLDKTRSAPLNALVGRQDGPLWYRGLAQEPDSFAPQLDEILAKLHARAIVVGHTVTPTGRVVTRFDGRVIQIDTGMQQMYVLNGHGSALEIKDDEATAIYEDRRDVVDLAKRVRTSAAGQEPGTRNRAVPDPRRPGS